MQSALSFGIKPGLERMLELSRYLGRPEQKLRVFHLAGTNGKGSTSSYLTHILASGGYRVGWFTSPYLERFTERIRVLSGAADLAAYDRDGQAGEIGEIDFARILSKIRQAVTDMLATGLEHPTEFELITAAAMLWFAEQNCDYVVLETGLGGYLMRPISAINSKQSSLHRSAMTIWTDWARPSLRLLPRRRGSLRREHRSMLMILPLLIFPSLIKTLSALY